MHSRACLVIVGVLLAACRSPAPEGTVAATQQTPPKEADIDAQATNSFLALSAFECSVVASDDKEVERLFNVGLKAGREFIAFVRSNPDVYQKSLRPKVAILWNMTSGPSADFILGQVYADRSDEIYRDFTTDEQVWRSKKEALYRQKNCSLLGK